MPLTTRVPKKVKEPLDKMVRQDDALNKTQIVIEACDQWLKAHAGEDFPIDDGRQRQRTNRFSIQANVSEELWERVRQEADRRKYADPKLFPNSQAALVEEALREYLGIERAASGDEGTSAEARQTPSESEVVSDGVKAPPGGSGKPPEEEVKNASDAS